MLEEEILVAPALVARIDIVAERRAQIARDACASARRPRRTDSTASDRSRRRTTRPAARRRRAPRSSARSCASSARTDCADAAPARRRARSTRARRSRAAARSPTAAAARRTTSEKSDAGLLEHRALLHARASARRRLRRAARRPRRTGRVRRRLRARRRCDPAGRAGTCAPRSIGGGMSAFTRSLRGIGARHGSSRAGDGRRGDRRAGRERSRELRVSRPSAPSHARETVCHTSAASPDPTTRADPYRPPCHHRLHRDIRARPRPRRACGGAASAIAAASRPTISRACRWPCAIGRVAGLEAQPLPDGFRRLRLPQQSPGLARAQRRRLPRRARATASSATAPIASRSSSAPRPRASARPKKAIARSTAIACRSTCAVRRCTRRIRSGFFSKPLLGTRGPCLTVATACSSSAKIFAKAERMIRLGIVDAAILAGVDTLCDSVLFGFNALELVSPEPCRPFDPARNGISIGEAAGFALVERDGDARAPRLIGYGESSDAHHMSTPHPEGLGARLALADALARAGIDAERRRLHQSARHRDARRTTKSKRRWSPTCFPRRVRASSTKGFTGHTLGAAGILEAVITLIAMEQGFVPATLNSRDAEPVCAAQLALAHEEREIRVALSNSFGFGGSNCTLAFAAGDAALRHGRAHRVRRRHRLLGARHCGLGRVASACSSATTSRCPKRTTRPSPAALPPTERRRAPEPVLLASEAAGQACDDGRTRCRRRSPACSHRRTAISRSPTRCARRSPPIRASSRRSASTIPCTTRRPVTGPSPRIAMRRRPRSAPATASFAAGLFEAALEVACRRRIRAARGVRHRRARTARRSRAERAAVRDGVRAERDAQRALARAAFAAIRARRDGDPTMCPHRSRRSRANPMARAGAAAARRARAPARVRRSSLASGADTSLASR